MRRRRREPDKDAQVMAAARSSNEGKACDAVLRYIETRDDAKRVDLIFPEKAHHVGPVELVCSIGPQRYALEHTRIEPIAGFIQLNAEAERHFKPLENMLVGKLPVDDRFELQIPFGVMLGKSDRAVRPIQEALTNWIVATAPTLPIARLGRVVLPVTKFIVPGVPFEVHLHRWKREGFPFPFHVTHLVGSDIESARRERIRTAYIKKLDKLLKWKKMGARAVLILEEDDIQLTNHLVVGDALFDIESSISEQPDEIYLLSTASAVWFGVPIRVDRTTLYDLELDKRYWETAPDKLADVTNLRD